MGEDATLKLAVDSGENAAKAIMFFSLPLRETVQDFGKSGEGKFAA